MILGEGIGVMGIVVLGVLGYGGWGDLGCLCFTLVVDVFICQGGSDVRLRLI